MCQQKLAVWIGLLCLFFCGSNLAGREIDRLLVSVNGTVITEGDLTIARNINPLVFSGNSVDPGSRREELDGLIDLELIRQELLNFSVDYEEAGVLEDRVRQLRDRLAKADGFDRMLARAGLQEEELDSYLKFQISIMDFVEYRFSPFAGVSEDEIEAYYKDTLGPQLRDSGLETPPLAEVSGRIEEILKAEKINEALEQWLQVARSNARIEYFDEGVPENTEYEQSRDRALPGAKE